MEDRFVLEEVEAGVDNLFPVGAAMHTVPEVAVEEEVHTVPEVAVEEEVHTVPEVAVEEEVHTVPVVTSVNPLVLGEVEV